MADLLNEEYGNTADKPRTQNVDSAEKSESAFSCPEEDRVKQNRLNKAKRKRRLLYISVSLCILLAAFVAAGYFFVLQPQMALTASIRELIRQELGDDVTPADMNKQVLDNLLRSMQSDETVYNITLRTPNYAKLTAQEVEKKVNAPAFDIAVKESEYLAMLSEIVANAASDLLISDPQGWTENKIKISVKKENGVLIASMDNAEKSRIKELESHALQVLVDQIFIDLPQAKLIEIAMQANELLASIFTNEYLLKELILRDVIETGDGAYSLVLQMPYPEGLEIYCKGLTLDAESSKLEIAVEYNTEAIKISGSEKERALATLGAYYSTIAEQLESMGKRKAASIAYAQGGVFTRSFAAYDWNDAVQVSNNAVAAVKLDGTVLFFGSLFQYEPNSNTMSLYEPDLSSWSNVEAITLTDTCIIGRKTDGTVLFDGAIWGYDSAAKRYLLHQPEVGTWTDIVQLAASDYGVAGLRKDGTVVSDGCYEVGPYQAHVLPFDTSSWKNVKQIYISYRILAGVCDDGSVVQTGSFRVSPSKCEQFKIDNLSDVIDLAINKDSMLALQSSGTVIPQGQCYQSAGNIFGLLPMDTSQWDHIQDVFLTDTFAVGIRTDKTVVGLGDPFGMTSYPFDWTLLNHYLSLEVNGLITALDQNGNLIVTGEVRGIDGLDEDGLAVSYTGDAYLTNSLYLLTLSGNWKTLLKVKISEAGNVIAGLRPNGELVWFGEIASKNKTILDLGSVICGWKLW